MLRILCNVLWHLWFNKVLGAESLHNINKWLLWIVSWTACNSRSIVDVRYNLWFVLNLINTTMIELIFMCLWLRTQCNFCLFILWELIIADEQWLKLHIWTISILTIHLWWVDILYDPDLMVRCQISLRDVIRLLINSIPTWWGVDRARIIFEATLRSLMHHSDSWMSVADLVTCWLVCLRIILLFVAWLVWTLRYICLTRFRLLTHHLMRLLILILL